MGQGLIFFKAVVLFLFLGAAQASDIVRLRAAADGGDPRAQYDLGIAYQQGAAIRRDLVEARRWWRKAADQGYAPAGRLLKEVEKPEPAKGSDRKSVV